MTAGVYQIVNMVTGKKYFGSSGDVWYRMQQHRRHLESGYHSNEHLQHAWKKYGDHTFHWDVYQYCDTREEALELEQQILTLFKTSGRWEELYNIADNVYCVSMTEEVKQKISDSLKGKPLTEQTKQKISESKIGTKHSEQTKQKMSEWHSNKPKSEEHKQKMSEANKGKILSEQHKSKISESLKGKTLSEETRQKIAEAAKRREALRREAKHEPK